MSAIARARCILLVVLSAPVVAAQSPTLTMRDANGNPLPLDLEELDVEVRFVADVAKTTVTLGFRNRSNRLAEGEFVMPLPAGATVSSYALEVQGAMREAVAVEKERARFAYESIKARRIDPGIVERQAGNVYRTRIFPIPREGIKRVRVGYVEHLPEVDGELRYELPFQEDEKIAAFSMVMTHHDGTDITLRGPAGLEFAKDADGQWNVKAKDVRITQRVGARWTAPDAAALHLDMADDGSAWFYLLDRFPEGIDAEARPVPDSLVLVWDASASGRERDREREFALLDAYFKALGHVRVRLQVLRNDRHDGGEFAIENGDWAELRTVLENVYYDGAAGFEKLEFAEGNEDAVLFFTDGVSPHSPLPRPAKPLFVIDAVPSQADASVRNAARESGGAYLDLSRLDAAAALRQLTEVCPGVVTVMGGLDGEVLLETNGAAGDPVRVVGRLTKEGLAGELKVVYGVPGGATRPRSVAMKEVARGGSGGIVKRLWAQRALEDIERTSPDDEDAIAAHCKRHRLVSDFTSLIVLERFSDHLRYGIPPPEPELLERYETAMRLRREDRMTGWRRLVLRWQDRQRWHQREFPWADVALLPRLRQVSIWSDAIDRVFAPDELDQEAFGVIDDWRRRTLSVMERKDGLRNAADYDQWLRQVGEFAAQGAELKNTPVAVPAGKPVVVSVRGLVNQPGKVTGAEGMTLQQAVEKAGGVHRLGTRTEVELYRNAGKTVYNLLSAQYEDVPLRPGDMVVVRDLNWRVDDRRDVDPFGEPAPPPDPAQAPPVVADSDLWLEEAGEGVGGAAPFGGADPFGSGDGGPAVNLSGEVRVIESVETEEPAMQDFAAALEAGNDADAAYRELKGKAPRPLRFHVEAARLLFAHGRRILGHQSLSNLLETPHVRLDRLIAAALWLEEFGQDEAAAELLRRGASLDPDLPLIRYHLARLALRDEASAPAADHLSAVVRTARHGNRSAAVIAFTDLAALDARMEDSPLRKLRREGMPAELRGSLDSDLRVVVSTNQPARRLEVWVDEPSGHTCRSKSPCGGLLTRADGLSEYMMHHALPGRYTVFCRSPIALSVHVTLYRNWGRPNQSSEEKTVLLDGAGRPIALAHYDVAFPE